MGISYDSTVWGAQFSGAQNLSADTSFNQPRTSQTVPTDAVQSMQPVEVGARSEWGGFFLDTAKSLVGYGLAKDAARNGVHPAPPAASSPAPAPQATQAQSQAGGPLMVAAIAAAAVVAVVVIVKVAK